MELPIISPKFGGDGIGRCSDLCEQYDGKRCKVLGFRPESICEPWVKQVVAERSRWPDLFRVE